MDTKKDSKIPECGDLAKLRGNKVVVGTKQLKKAMLAGTAKCVFLAENADPAAVVFDAVHEARKQNTDILICDTAGRLHNKKNLMEELRKIARVIEREYPAAHKEVYLVLDATTGQNALQQAKLFQEVADITGIVLTKLDGTAKGGIVVAIKSELKLPVRYIGVGEGIHDLQKFHAAEFAGALFGKEA